MSLSVYLYNFQKRKNSTKQPTGGSPISCTLKDDCTITNPVLTFNVGNQSYKSFNYCYIPDFGRYYFITDWTMHANLIWTCSCTVDVLATYKGNISNYQGFVERSSSNFNALINDPYVSPEQNIVRRSHTNLAINGIDTDGCFIVRTSGKKGLATDEFVTGVNTYAFSPANFKILCENMFDTGASDIAQVITEEAVKAFFNPFQYVLSIMWFPFDEATLGNATSIPITIPTFGWFDGTAPAYCVTDCYTAVNAGTLVRPPSLYSTDDFRAHSSNWTRYTCYLPGVGIVELSPEDVIDDIYVSAVVDPLTGEITYILDCSGIIRQFVGQIGVPVQIAQLASNPGKAIGNAISAGASLISGNPIAAVGSAVSAIQNALQPTMSVNGNQGSMAMLKYKNNITLYCEQFGSAGLPTNQYGRACYKNTIIGSSWSPTNNLFLKLGAASIPISGTESEITEINNLVNSGFYYE